MLSVAIKCKLIVRGLYCASMSATFQGLLLAKYFENLKLLNILENNCSAFQVKNIIWSFQRMAIIMMKRLPICSYGTRTNKVKFKNKVGPADLLRRVDFSSSKIGVTRFDEKYFFVAS